MLQILLILIFLRPFISSLAFPFSNFIYSTILLGFLFIWLIYKGIPKETVKTLKLPLGLFLLALVISIIFSIDWLNSLKESYKYISGLLIFLAALSLKNEDKRRAIRAIILSGFIISLLAIYQYFWGFRHLLNYLSRQEISFDFAMDYIQRRRVFFPFVTPNTLGGYLAMIIPLVFWRMGPAPKNNAQSLFLSPFFTGNLYFIAVFSALILTQSLGAFFSLLAGLILYLYLRKSLDNKKLLFIAGFLILLIGAVFLMRQAVGKEHSLPSFSLIMRLDYWKEALRMILAHPFTGVGPGNFNLVYSRYAHNSYLQLWAEIGILGFISFLWLIFNILRTKLQNLKNYSLQKDDIYLLAAIFIFLTHNLIDFTFFLPEVSLIWWAILGLALARPLSAKD